MSESYPSLINGPVRPTRSIGAADIRALVEVSYHVEREDVVRRGEGFVIGRNISPPVQQGCFDVRLRDGTVVRKATVIRVIDAQPYNDPDFPKGMIPVQSARAAPEGAGALVRRKPLFALPFLRRSSRQAVQME